MNFNADLRSIGTARSVQSALTGPPGVLLSGPYYAQRLAVGGSPRGSACDAQDSPSSRITPVESQRLRVIQ